ncbi:MAG: 3-methyl-2-oxobutanoate dehydrogenase subunit VorB [Clostridiales bacterium]|jgi:2-oxoglutarate ferredoxin oxidoreductase subunit alpha|nr:3-methyl-2-oxobutanoate dehydrogenase subunit VorB [Clostridiales bacterium]
MKILMKGNEAIAAAAIAAGCRAFFGYPITPQNEIVEYMVTKMPAVGGVFVQAESEVAAVNMAYGAAATGVRTMTSSSSPGIALKQEGISYMAGADLPCVIVSVSRAGPGLGGILPAQGDYFQATRGGGNGDYYLPVYAPFSIQEAMDLVYKAFNVADLYRTPVMVLADGMLGQMMEPVLPINNEELIMNNEKCWAANGDSGRGRRNIANSLSLKAEALEEMNLRRFATYEIIRAKEIMVDNRVTDGDEVALVAYGTPARIVLNSIEILKSKGIKAGLVRPITLWPFPYESFQNLPASVKNVVVCELSMGQMVEDVRLGVAGKIPVHFYGRTGGMIFEPEEIAEKVIEVI